MKTRNIFLTFLIFSILPVWPNPWYKGKFDFIHKKRVNLWRFLSRL